MIAAFAPILACLLAGCTNSDLYGSSGKMPVSRVSKRRLWRASGELKRPELATDGRLDTAAISTLSYAGATLTIDLGKPSLFNLVVIDHGRNHFGFCRRVGILTSSDGKTYTQRYAAPGTRRLTTLLLPRHVLARYVRLQAIVPGDNPWSVAEVYFQ